MALARLDQGNSEAILGIAAARFERVPRHPGALRQVSLPYPTYVTFTRSRRPVHVGWEVLGFDDGKPVAMVEVAERDGELRWVNTTQGMLPFALTEAMREADRLYPDTTMAYGVVKAPQAGLSFLWLENGIFIPLRVPHVRNEMPDEPLDEAGV